VEGWRGSPKFAIALAVGTYCTPEPLIKSSLAPTCQWVCQPRRCGSLSQGAGGARGVEAVGEESFSLQP